MAGLMALLDISFPRRMREGAFVVDWFGGSSMNASKHEHFSVRAMRSKTSIGMRR